MSMVYSSGTEVKRNFTANDTMLQFWGTFSFLILTVRSFVLLTEYLHRVKGDKSWAKYFASWQLVVLMFEIIGLRRKLLMLPSGGNLWILAVPQNFPAQEPVGYNWYSFCDNLDLNFLNNRYIFPSPDFVGSWFSFVNWFVSSIPKHLFVYLVLSIKKHRVLHPA